MGKCSQCDTVGIYMEVCENCGKMCNEAVKQPEESELAEELEMFAECYKCEKRIDVIGSKCICGGFYLNKIKKTHNMIGCMSECSICTEIGIFGNNCHECDGFFLEKLNNYTIEEANVIGGNLASRNSSQNSCNASTFHEFLIFV